jgi:hypothetical protein
MRKPKIEQASVVRYESMLEIFAHSRGGIVSSAVSADLRDDMGRGAHHSGGILR